MLEECGFNSRNQLDKQLGKIQRLRDKVMHANSTLIRDKSDIQNLLDRVNMADRIVRNLE